MADFSVEQVDLIKSIFKESLEVALRENASIAGKFGHSHITVPYRKVLRFTGACVRDPLRVLSGTGSTLAIREPIASTVEPVALR